MSNISQYAMYVIGTVESNCRWDAVNYNDPITLGIMQWYGSRAANLIRVCSHADATGYADFKSAAPTLAGQAETNSINFDTRYVTQAEGQAWIRWAGRKENHTGQQQVWNSDFSNYEKICDNYGFPQQNVKERIFWMCMYHQSPVSAIRVLGSCSATASLQLLHTTALNDGVLGNYENRYNTAYNLLNSWDGVSAPPDFGQTGETGQTGGNGQPIHPTQGHKGWIEQRGDNLYLFEGSETRFFKKSTAQNWVEGRSEDKPINGDQQPGAPPSDPGASGNKAVDWVKARLNKFAYSQAGGRLNPDSTGYTDCSGLWWRAYQDTLGIDVGTWTGQMAQKGTRIAHSDTDSIQSAIAKVKSGDLLLLAWNSRNPSYDHVCGFIADGQSAVYSHGGPGNGPTLMDGIKDEMNIATMWEIRRYV